MSDLLYIEGSPRGGRSHSSAVAAGFLQAFRSSRPAAIIDHLNPWTADLPRFDGAALSAKYAILGGSAHDAVQRRAWEAVEAAVDRLRAADRILLSVPMWNFSLPYALKHYIDVVTQPGLTFAYSPATGYRGLLTGKRAAIVYASAGDYRAGSGNPRPDLQKPLLEAWLRFIGIDDIRTVTVQPTLDEAARLAAAVAAAAGRAAAMARDF